MSCFGGVGGDTGFVMGFIVVLRTPHAGGVSTPLPSVICLRYSSHLLSSGVVGMSCFGGVGGDTGFVMGFIVVLRTPHAGGVSTPLPSVIA